MSTTPLDHVAFEHLGAVYFSEETVTFGTAGTERRAAPETGTVSVKATQVSVDAMTLSPIPFDARTPMQGDKGGEVAFSYYLQPSATLLDELGTLPTDATMPGRIPLRVLFGGESIPDVGTQAATPTSSTAFTVDSGDGANFPAGQVCAVYNSTNGLEVAQVRSRSGDDLTVYPALTGTPGNNADVVNFVCFYPTRTNSRSMSVAGTGRNTDRQYRFNGCTGSCALKFERNGLAVAEFSLQAATYTGPAALSLAVTRSEDPAGSPLAVRNAICWLQAVGTTTRVDTAVEKVDIALNFGNIHLTSLTGTLEGKRATARGDGLNNAFAKITLEMPDNEAVFTWYADQSELNFTFIVRAGSGAARRHVVVMAPQCVIESVPEIFKGEGNLRKLRVVLRAKVSEQCAGTLDNEELAQAPFILALG
jgi:hypothetical protein